jgi:hypothetical protein
MRYCQSAKRKRAAAKKGEPLVVHSTTDLNGAPIQYTASPDDKRLGIEREAVCAGTGTQWNIPLNPRLQNRLGIFTSTVRATLKTHDELRAGEEDRFTVNGTEQKINLSELTGQTLTLLAANTPRISTYEAFPLVSVEVAATPATRNTQPGAPMNVHPALLSQAVGGAEVGAYSG